MTDLEEDLKGYLNDLDANYVSKARSISLFAQTDLNKALSLEQKKFLVALLYHIRGHFHDFLWYLLNFAPDKVCKDLIMSNIAEEAGGDKRSHEELYACFAMEYDFDIKTEIATEAHHLPFIKAFNRSHLAWLSSKTWPYCFSAYSAYERLDNIDYRHLYDLAKSMGTSANGMVFFDIHTKVTHFETTANKLNQYWHDNRAIVEDAYDFIYQSQLAVWRELSNKVLNFTSEDAVY